MCEKGSVRRGKLYVTILLSAPGKGFTTETLKLGVLCTKLSLKYYETLWEGPHAEFILHCAFQEQSSSLRGADKEDQQISGALKSLALILRLEGRFGLDERCQNYSIQVVHVLCGLGPPVVAYGAGGSQG